LHDHLEGILNYCRTKVRLGVEAVNGNIKALLQRGRGYRDLNYPLLKPPRPNSSFSRKLLKIPASSDSRSEPNNTSTHFK